MLQVFSLNTALIVEMKDVVVEHIIGRGNYGVVHKGRWHRKEVAVKRIKIPCDTSFPTSTLLQEVQILRYLTFGMCSVIHNMYNCLV